MYKFMLRPLVLILLLTLMPVITAQDDPLTNVCMVTDIGGGVEGGNYMRLAYEGLVAVGSDYGLNVMLHESVTLDDFVPELETCIADGAQIIVTIGANLSTPTLDSALANPDVYYIAIDELIQEPPPNMVLAGFREDEAGFLVGYLAGLVTESNIVAGVYGVPFPALKRFRNGFEQGVRYAAEEEGKDITILGVYLDDFGDARLGAGAASVFVEQGADVIFGAAGLTGSGAILEAAEKGVYVIGVDQDEYFTTFEGGTVPGAEYIISSALKRVDVAVYTLVSILVEGRLDEFPGGSTYVLGVDQDGLTFANPHDSDIPAEVYDRVAELLAQMAGSEISTGVDTETGDLLGD